MFFSMNKPFLSIIIPVYNGSRYLRETISSVLQQPCNDYELLLLDDGSKDNSFAICKKYESKQVIVEHHENIGVSRTRNLGISMARGEVIIFIDQDDAMRSNFYTEKTKERLQELLQQRIELILNGTWYGDSELVKGHFNSIEKRKKGIYLGHQNALSWGYSYCFNANLFARTLFFDKKGKPTPVRFFELPLDVETIFRHLTQYSARKLMFSDELSFCIRRINNESVSSTWDWLKVYDVKCRAYYDVIDWHKTNNPKDKESIEGAEKSFLRVVEDMIRENFRAKPDLSSLLEKIKKETYFPHLKELSQRYHSLIVTTFINDPNSLGKYFHVSWFRKLIRLRWKVYNKFFNSKPINLRKELLVLK